jgi:serine protease AprX
MRTLSRSALLAIVAVALIVPSRPHADWTSKLDRALAEIAEHSGATRVRALIRARAGAVDAVAARLARRAVPTTALNAPDLLVAQFPSTKLQQIAVDPDIERLSLDAVVKGQASNLALDTLLGTEGLLNCTTATSCALATPYKGANIGVAIIDSGVTSGSGDLSSITFYDVTNNMKQGGEYDDYGHGTHVAGLMASKGSFSNYQYQGIAPSTQMIHMKVLDKNGNGYTSDVIKAINYVVANRSRLHLKVINLSLGHPVYESVQTDPLVQAVENAIASGIVVVVAAGNFGGDVVTHEVGYGGVTSPGNAPDAITVGAVDTFNTNTRNDDVIPWYSSRGPSWIDGYQKPDVVAPGSHLVSSASTISTIYKTYPKGIVPVNGKQFIKMSGTSMAAPVVSGIVADMMEANAKKHPGYPLTPNAVKAILQYTAIPLAGYDTLTQGAGAVNAAGAIALAEAIDPSVPVGSWWLSTAVNPYTTIAGQQLSWGQRVVWGDRVVWGNHVYTNDPAWALRVVWGNRMVWGNRVVWGNSTVWDDGSPLVWGNRVVWGQDLIGQTAGSSTHWGGLDGNATASRVVWGNVSTLNIAPTSMSWGNLERSNQDIK